MRDKAENGEFSSPRFHSSLCLGNSAVEHQYGVRGFRGQRTERWSLGVLLRVHGDGRQLEEAKLKRVVRGGREGIAWRRST